MIECLATVVHAGAAVIHAAGAVRGSLPRELRGAAIALHLLSIVYNWKKRNHLDVGAHVGAIVATLQEDRTTHALATVYDLASAVKHYRASKSDF